MSQKCDLYECHCKLWESRNRMNEGGFRLTILKDQVVTSQQVQVIIFSL